MAEKEYILAQNIGALDCAASLFSLSGAEAASNMVHYSYSSNDRDWRWQSPEIWWRAFCQNCRTLLSNIPKDSVRTVSVCGQMMSCLPVDPDIRPLSDAILFTDRRSVNEVKQIHSLLGADRIYDITGICLSHTFSLSKIMWLKKNHPDIYRKTAYFIQCKDYINYRLTGRLVTDETDASFTQMYDLYRRQWSDEILTAFGLGREKLPEVLPFGSILGKVTPKASEECGLSCEATVVLGVGDGRVPAIGSGAVRPGEGCIYLGNSSWLSQVSRTSDLDPDRTITKTPYFNGMYLNGGASLSGRRCADWYLNTFSYGGEKPGGSEAMADFLTRQLLCSPAGSNGVLFMPYLHGERSPWWNNDARGAFIGLCAQHSHSDLFRSILEGIAFQLGLIKKRTEGMEPFTNIYLAGNGSFLQWQQILSDVMETDITSFAESGNVKCIGAALIAGIAIGAYQDYSEIARFHHDQVITSPIRQNVKVYQELLPAFEDCYYALQDINRHLGQVDYSKLKG